MSDRLEKPIGSRWRVSSVHWATKHLAGLECTIVDTDKPGGWPVYIAQFDDGRTAVLVDRELVAIEPSEVSA